MKKGFTLIELLMVITVVCISFSALLHQFYYPTPTPVTQTLEELVTDKIKAVKLHKEKYDKDFVKMEKVCGKGNVYTSYYVTDFEGEPVSLPYITGCDDYTKAP